MITIKELHAGYGKTEVLHGISTVWEKGKLLSVIGPNGSGKSTLLKTAAGILPPASGEILVDGTGGLPSRALARKIAYLAQGKAVPDMTVRQMVLHGRFPHLKYPRRYTAHDEEIARAAMEEVGVLALADVPLAALSGGQRQNAYIAMALAQDTDYILLDEPTTYLDIAHQLSLLQTLRKLADSGKGIVAVMHDLPLAFTFSDAVTILQDGRSRLCGTPREVAQSGLVSEVFGVSVEEGENGFSYRYSHSTEK